MINVNDITYHTNPSSADMKAAHEAGWFFHHVIEWDDDDNPTRDDWYIAHPAWVAEYHRNGGTWAYDYAPPAWLEGTLTWRETHAGEEFDSDFVGSPREIAETLARLATTGCGCCAPSFVTAEGFRAHLDPDGSLSWGLTAWGGERLGLRLYQARHVGVTDVLLAGGAA